MNENELRTHLIEQDKKTLEDRVKRRTQISHIRFDSEPPDLVWDYLSETVDMYTNGQFLGTIIFCASIMERVLFHQLRAKTKMTDTALDSFNSNQLLILTHELGILTEQEFGELDELRKLRNLLIHGDAQRLAKMARSKIQIKGSKTPVAPVVYVGLYLSGEIDQDALRYLQITRNLADKFYGEKQ